MGSICVTNKIVRCSQINYNSISAQRFRPATHTVRKRRRGGGYRRRRGGRPPRPCTCGPCRHWLVAPVTWCPDRYLFQSRGQNQGPPPVNAQLGTLYVKVQPVRVLAFRFLRKFAEAKEQIKLSGNQFLRSASHILLTTSDSSLQNCEQTISKSIL